MELTVKGRNIEINDRIREYVEKKIGRLERYLPDEAEARVELYEQNTRKGTQRHVAQVTMRSNGALLRAEERSADLFAAIDAVSDKLQRQIRRFRGKRRRKIERAQIAAAEDEWLQAIEDELALPEEGAEEEQFEGRIVRFKRFPMVPMTEEEAIDQMELLGHDFFIFYNDGDRAVNVIYRRGDGNYGLLQPELA